MITIEYIIQKTFHDLQAIEIEMFKSIDSKEFEDFRNKYRWTDQDSRQSHFERLADPKITWMCIKGSYDLMKVFDQLKGLPRTRGDSVVYRNDLAQFIYDNYVVTNI